MVTNNDPNEIIADCKTKADPIGCLEIYVRYLCDQLELKDERIRFCKNEINYLNELLKP
jgi:hypothetical protein